MDIFNGAILSLWNSVSGPKIEHMWLLNDHVLSYFPKERCVGIKNFEIIKDCYSFLSSNRSKRVSEADSKEKFGDLSAVLERVQIFLTSLRQYLRMSGKLLLTEMETKRPFLENCSRIYHLEDKILFSVVFYKQFLQETKDTENKHLCVSIMLNSTDFEHTLKIQKLIDLHLRKVASCIQKSSLLNKEFMATEVSKYFDELCEAFEELKVNHKSDQLLTVPRFAQFQLRAKFLARAIVSHMETSGCSIVIGTSKFTVNQVAQILLLFNNDAERCCSVLTMKNAPQACHRGLYVQGLLRDNLENQRLSLPEDYYDHCPISIIDTDSYKVRQSLSERSSDYSRNSLKTVTDSGTLIPQYLQNLFLCEEHKWPTNDLLRNLRKFIYIRSVTLVKIMKKLWYSGIAANEKQLMNLMNVSNKVDFNIYLGFAEKLKPGIKNTVM